jgi:hypothetical protein
VSILDPTTSAVPNLDPEKAIWNTNAFFAYIITVKLYSLKWEPRRLSAVFLATVGVLAVVYGGATSGGGNSNPEVSAVAFSIKPSAPLVGNLLTLIASITYGLYQVLYKKYAALPSDPEELLYDEVPSEEPAVGSIRETPSPSESITLPFGLHANLLTSAIGLLTLVVVWIFIPICHYLNLETFALPANLTTCLVIAGISLSGWVVNAGFMVSFPLPWHIGMSLLICCIHQILLGTWGPIVTSVGSLLTIVLIFLTDVSHFPLLAMTSSVKG